MIYCDLHCDALTTAEVRQVTRERLQAGGCLLQCFAAFVAENGGFSAFLSLADAFDRLCAEEGYHPVLSAKEIVPGKINALLTVEGGGEIGDGDKLDALCARGVRMMSFTWNTPNGLGFPNFPDYAGMLSGRRSLAERESARGLTRRGFEAAERMGELGMIVDVSHGSDRLFYDVAGLRRPFAASHSGAQAVFDCARNLTDGQIRRLADCGGVVGLDFCADFLSSDTSREGQKRAILAHAEHILRVGGEDVLALGSDFDGIPPNPYLKDPASMPDLLTAFAEKFGPRRAEKIASKNILRLFAEVCG